MTKTRKRGGANILCPVCAASTRVQETRRRADIVVRWRTCMRHNHRFVTEERVLNGGVTREKRR